MKLIDLLQRERVVVPLTGGTLSEAAAELVGVLVGSGATGEPEKLEGLLADSLPKEVIPVGPEAFMLHFRTDAVTTTAVALGVSPVPVYRERDSTKDARIVILIVAPLGESGAFEFLQVQGGFAQALSKPEVVEGILAAATPEDVLHVAPLAEITLPGYLTVGDVMKTDVLSVRADQTLAEAAKLMVGREVPALPVVTENGEVVGMVGYRQLLRHVLPPYVKRLSGEVPAGTRTPRRPKDPQTASVRSVMDRNVMCVSEEQTIADVANIMVNKDVDRFPVVRDGVLVGFITRGDIVRRVLGG
ncbi:MAG: CBS domain-containing protein [Gemmatimonadetes bacterium]|nr:CBS domain-containing protein [Gemmatimonadota bacterium]